MKAFAPHLINGAQARLEWAALKSLLSGATNLSEQRDILPFFRARKDLSVLIGTYYPKIVKADRFAHELQIYGDFAADLVVGDSTTQNYVLVEFEDGTPDGLFVKRGKKATPEWSPRFEHAHSQLVDWLWKLEDMRGTAHFQSLFGHRRATFHGLIVIGKGMTLSDQEKDRLSWRISRTRVDSTAIDCVSFDQLATDLDHWLKMHHNV
jgi:hypothetical protein